ncbi:MAG: zinc-binding dehydrogenase [Chloroflexi bacterium]|nr:zinc-binding dehydrogenase [Chloroflexota bacterium]
MKKVTITGVREARIVDVPTPHAVGDWVLVKVHAIPMCTEYKAFAAGQPTAHLGHEAAGEVVEVAQPGPVQVGDRVVAMPFYPCGRCALCRSGDFIYCQHAYDYESYAGTPEGQGTYNEYLLKPAWILGPIPDGVSYEHGSLAVCGLGPTFGAMDRMGVNAFDTLLITGMGPVGLGGAVNAAYRGTRLISVESIPYRAQKARELGAEAVIDPNDPQALQQVMDLTHGVGVDAAIDCSGTVAAERFCIDATRRRGQVAFVGECYASLPIQISPDMIRKGLTIHGSWHYNMNLFPKVMQVIERSPLVGELISHTFPLSAAQQALELTASNQTAKVILKPWM